MDSSQYLPTILRYSFFKFPRHLILILVSADHLLNELFSATQSLDFLRPHCFYTLNSLCIIQFPSWSCSYLGLLLLVIKWWLPILSVRCRDKELSESRWLVCFFLCFFMFSITRLYPQATADWTRNEDMNKSESFSRSFINGVEKSCKKGTEGSRLQKAAKGRHTDNWLVEILTALQFWC